ncbi:MAG TPA: ABC transporter substrate-binding protein [Xanthobacteraceae bacterium]|nr:ABC transporter substrate-binding protein [Xanthobacteraceae bacterium]
MSRSLFGTAAVAGFCAIALGMAMTAPVQAAEKWRHGIVEAKGDSAFLFMAAKGGFAAKHGLDLEMVQFTGGTTPLKALIAGELDSFEASPVVAFPAMMRGADVKFIGCDWPGMTYTLFASKKINTPADLKGQTIGVSAPGSLPDLFAREALASAGVPEDTLKFANAGGSADRVKAVIAGVVAAGASSSEYEVDADRLGYKALLRGDSTPQFVKVCMMSTSKKIAQRRKAMEAFLAASMEGLTYASTHRDEAIKLAKEVANLGSEDKTAAFVYDEAIKYKAVHYDLSIPKENLQSTADMMVKHHALDKKIDVTKYIDDSARTEALNQVKK